MMLFIGLFLSINLFSQQLPDPHFEDWSSEFDGTPQPRYWHADNVEQSGFKFTLMTKGAGRSGNCLVIQNKDCKAMGIGQTSPGYAGLGNPWQYIKGIDLQSASGGMDGGISFTYHPDTMVVWIKRTGSNAGSENYNILFYSWNGTFRGSKYRAQSGDCASTSHTNEESDIRQALDANSCGTDSKGTQVAEGWIYEKKSYGQWTQVKIPIYYFSDLSPQMCNVIFSSGNYPNLRATGGINDGNTLMVDDVELLYSSRIQKLYIGGKEWKGFDPNVLEQTYSLGRTATEIPDIEAIRGVGSLTAPSGRSASFAGRKLQSNELTITPGQIDGTPTLITVKAEDGSSSTTYKISFVREASTNARLASIRVNGEEIPNFKPTGLTYDVDLPYGTTQAPVVTVDKQEEEQTVQITQPTSVTGTAEIKVTAADQKTTLTYSLRFRVAPLSDNTLQDIKVNGHSVVGFNPGQTIYKVSLPTTTTVMPTVEAISAYPAGAQTITHTAPSVIDGGQYLIAVSTPGNPTPKTYKLTFRLEASDYAYLSAIYLDGKPLPGFEPTVMNYSLTLPLGTVAMPTITWDKGEEGQNVVLTEGGIDGTSRLQVTADNKVDQVTYKITFSTLKSDISTLNSISVGGVAIPDFTPTQTQYTVELPIGTTTVPDITVVKGDPYQTVTITPGPLNGITRIVVTAGNGNTTVYQVLLSVQQATDNTLNMIYLDGQPLPGFQKDRNEYDCPLPKGTTTLPVVTYDVHDEFQVVTTRSGGVNGDYKITVRPQSGSSRTYILHFHVESSANTALTMLYLDGEPLPGFHPDTLNYIDSLPVGVSVYPVVTWDKAEASQRVLSVESKGCQYITVTAENGSKRTYTILFVERKSENAFLTMIYLDGQPLADFDPHTLSYAVTLSDSAFCPVISVDKENGQQVTMISPVSVGDAQIRVQPEQGAANIYRIAFTREQYHPSSLPNDHQENTFSPDSTVTLQALLLNGQPLSDWDPTRTSYHVSLPAGSSLPDIQYIPGHATQSILCGWDAPQHFSLLVRSQRGDTLGYSVSFQIAPFDDPRLADLQIEGQTFTFNPDQFDYSLPLDEGVALPQLHLTKREGQTTLWIADSDSSQQVAVLAQSGRKAIYRIHYHRALSANAWLQTILLHGDTLPGFRPDSFVYVDTLPWRTKIVPSVMAIGQRTNQTITTYFSAINGTTRIHVEAANGQASNDYTIAFPVVKSTNTALKDLYLSSEQVAITFDPNQTDYAVALPYQSTEVPGIVYEKAEPEQTVHVDSVALWDTTRITVTAENGSTRQYRIVFYPTRSTQANKLQSLTIAQTGQTIHPDSLHAIVPLPYGATALTVQYTKAFAEQTVLVQPGGVTQPTIITVRANRPDEPDRIITLTPQVSTQNPAVLTDLKINGATIPSFSSNRFAYIVNVSATPVVSYTPAPSATVVVHVQDSKHWQATVSANGFSNTYDMWYYYPADVIPNAEFTQWTTAKYNNADKPVGWTVVADAAEKYLSNTTGTECNNSSNTIARLRSVYKGLCCRSTPGVITLGKITGELNATNSFTVSGSITFHNSPDQMQIRYNAPTIYNKNRIVYDLTGSNAEVIQEHNDTESFSDYRTLTIDLTSVNAAVGNPIALNIILNSYYAEQGGLGTEGMGTTSEMNVDWIHLLYNSQLQSLKVNGQDATLTDQAFAVTLTDAENDLLPTLSFTGQVADQAQNVVWQPQSLQGEFMVRKASITNYAEDGTSTAYTLTVKRPLSAIDTLSTILIGGDTLSTFEALKTDYTIALPHFDASLADIYPVPASAHQQVTLTQTDTIATISVQSEKGTTRVITLHFTRPSAPMVPVISATEDTPVTPPALTTGLLSEIELDGNIPADFVSTTFDYIKPRPTITSFVRQFPTDSVIYIQTPTHMQWEVYGSEQHTYTITYPTDLSANTHLSSIWVNDSLLSGWDAHITDYSLPTDTAVSLMALRQEDAQSVTLSLDTALRTFALQVTAADGTIGTPYSVQLVSEPSADASLASILLDSVALPIFHPDTLHYTIILPVGEVKIFEPQIPSLRYATTHAHAKVEVTAGALGETTYLHVTARDGFTTRQYEIDFEAEPSHNASLTGIAVDGVWLDHFEPGRHYYSTTSTRPHPVIGYTADDRFQSYSILQDNELYRIVVTAQDGVTTEEYQVEIFHQQPSSDATLRSILLNGVPMAQFDSVLNPRLTFHPMQNQYTIHLSSGASLPDVSAFMATEGQSAQLGSTTDEIWMEMMAPDSVTTNRYHLFFDRPKSDNSALSMLFVDGDSIADFDPNRFAYDVELPMGVTTMPEVAGQPAHAGQQVLPTRIDSTSARASIQVVAEDSVHTSTYFVQFHFHLSSIDTLKMIREDGQPLSEFQAHTYAYSRTLPKNTQQFPAIDWDEGDGYQTVHLDTIRLTSYEALFQIVVTAQNGSVAYYSLAYSIALSDIDTLQSISVNSRLIPSFRGLQTEYVCTVDTIASISWEKGDIFQTDTLYWQPDTLTAHSWGTKAKIQVTAQNGSTRTYTICLTRPLSADANLQMIYVGGVELDNFEEGTYQYTLYLPEGTPMPLVTWDQLPNQSVVLEQEDAQTVILHVTAEDGTSQQYRITISYIRSSNTQLAAILLDSVEIIGFDPATYEYSIYLPYGTTVLPSITVELQEPDQTAEIGQAVLQPTGEQTVTITVTAPNGDDAAEYRIIFMVDKNADATLRSLKVRGQELEGFHPDTTDYTLSYPVGTPSSAWAQVQDLSYTLSDSLAKDTAYADAAGTLYVEVTAQNGDRLRYAVHQRTLLSSNTRLKEIRIDGSPLPDFDPDITLYHYYVGDVQPTITATPEDSASVVTYSRYISGEDFYIYITAPDGSEDTYTILMDSVTISAAKSPTGRDVLVKHTPRSMEVVFATIRKNVSVGIYDENGTLLCLMPVPESNQNDVTVFVDAQGTETLMDVRTAHATFTLPRPHCIYFYVFYENSKRAFHTGKLAIRGPQK